MIAAGVVGALVAVWLGPDLAMGFAIWSGGTTEPTRPELGFPWLLWGGGIVLWAVSMQLQSHHKVAILLTQGGAMVVALLPWVHLWRLGSLAG